MRFTKFVAIAVLFAVPTFAQAASYYVANSGNDANAGTITAPFRTITKAATVVAPGDVVNVRGGIHNDLVKINSKGTAAARITFRSYPGEKAILDGTGTAFDTNLVQIGGDYIDFVGFEVRNSTRIGIEGRGAQNLRIANNDVHHCQRGGIFMTDSVTRPGTDFVIENNTVSYNVLQNQYLTATEWGQALSVYRTSRSRIVNNKVFKNYGEGLDFIMSDYGHAEGNEVYDNFSVNLYLDNARYMTVTRNLVYSTNDRAFYRGGHPALGISMQNETYEYPNLLTDITITNNVVIDGFCGIYYSDYGRGGGLKNTTIANNTIYKADWALVWLDPSTHTNTVIQNNIFYQINGGEMATQNLGAGVKFASNNWSGGIAGTAASATDVIGDPRMVQPGALNAAGYKLTSASPLLQRGLSLSAIVKNDYFGNSRLAAFDIGAHQLSGAAVADTQAPSVPQNFRTAGGAGTRLDLVWDAATDNIAVTGYTVTRNGVAVATVSGTTWSDTNVLEATLYAYTVQAIDAAGNRSAASATITAAWNSSAGATDTIAPTAPRQLRAQLSTPTSVALDWRASTDAVGVQSYDVYRDGQRLATLKGTRLTYSDANLSSKRTYTYSIIAVDAAGNRSAASNSVQITTPSAARRRAVR
jgi:parallel beta-helix repeat protein